MKQLAITTIALSAILAAVFWPARHGEQVLFSNDGPLGSVVAATAQPPASSVGIWNDLNWAGMENPPLPLSTSSGFRVLCFHPKKALAAALFILGVLMLLRATGATFDTAVKWVVVAICLVCAVCCTILGVGVACGLIDRLGESAWYNAPLVTTFLFPWLLMLTLARLPVPSEPNHNPNYKP